MKRSTVTVVMPNYNHARFLPRAIEEILEQSRPPDEFLILDDASTDESAAIIADYAAKNRLIRFMRSDVNLGVIAAHQRLFEEAQGDYVYAGAADDIRLPGFLEEAMKLAEQHPRAGLICGRMNIVDEHDSPLGYLAIRRWREPLFADPARFLSEYLEVEAPSHSLCGATVYRRDALKEVGWYCAALGSWGDTFSARAIGLAHGACYTPQPLTAWRRLAGSFSHDSRSSSQFTLNLIDRAAAWMESSPFADRFPADHVRRWRARYRRQVVWSEFWGEGVPARPRTPRFWLRLARRAPHLPGAAKLFFLRQAPPLTPPSM